MGKEPVHIPIRLPRSIGYCSAMAFYTSEEDSLDDSDSTATTSETNYIGEDQNLSESAQIKVQICRAIDD